MSLRKVYYALPPKLRLLVRKLAYAPLDLFKNDKYANGLPVPPRSLIFTGGGDFRKTGERFLRYFVDHGLEKDHHVVDIGSGMGRMALPLTNHLIGKYDGIDIMPQAVEWCSKNITSQFPNFRFHYLEVKNDLYRNSGQEASQTRLPLASDMADYSILISVFTHMLPTEVEQYLKEINRCLKIGGKCFATFFVYLDDHTLTNNNFQKFLRQDNQHALMDLKVKGANVAYNIEYLRSIFQKSGFEIDHISDGKWKNTDSQKDFQDFVVLRKTRAYVEGS